MQTTVDGAELPIIVTGRTADLIEEDGELVSRGTTPVTADEVFRLVDAGRT